MKFDEWEERMNENLTMACFVGSPNIWLIGKKMKQDGVWYLCGACVFMTMADQQGRPQMGMANLHGITPQRSREGKDRSRPGHV